MFLTLKMQSRSVGAQVGYRNHFVPVVHIYITTPSAWLEWQKRDFHFLQPGNLTVHIGADALDGGVCALDQACLLYTSPSPRD